MKSSKRVKLLARRIAVLIGKDNTGDTALAVIGSLVTSEGIASLEGGAIKVTVEFLFRTFQTGVAQDPLEFK